MKRMQAEPITEPVAHHGEGPVWSPKWGGLRFVDMLAGDVLSLDASGAIARRHVGDIAAAIRPRQVGGAVIGVERGFALEDADGTITALGELWSGSEVRMNEGGCDPHGRFYCGTMAYDRTPGAGKLFRLDTDLSVRVELEGVTISNGLDWSPDGAFAYYNDTPTHRVDVFSYEEERGLHDRRPFVDLSGDGLRPDGLTVDADGRVWVAFSNGSAVRCYTPQGRLDAVVELRARKVTACAFGGHDLRELYITTSRDGVDPLTDPLAGSLFQVIPGATGQPVREFAG